MQQEWDYIDKVIADSCPRVPVSSNYNSELMNKLHHAEDSNISYKVTALSFIMSGFLLILFNTPSIQYFLLNLEFAIKNSIIILQHII